ncbi:hypothetical protein ccbrp13_40550 [Ktedonobacteria bacterium brp13]|nr:hypothetical protein ccbrp13_40550 [Ktedonobacteria bacterium brp13]
MDRIKQFLRQPMRVFFIVVALLAIVMAGLAYHLVSASPAQDVTAQRKAVTPTPEPSPTPKAAAAHTPQYLTLPVQDRSKVLGIGGDLGKNFDGIGWIRISHPSCGWGNEQGTVLQKTIQSYHKRGIRVLFTICQSSSSLQSDMKKFADAAQAHPDAVQCGNEEMKQDASVSFLYVPPSNFAAFYNACESAIHKVSPQTPVLLGSLDPHVASADYQLMENQVSYLNQMQTAMNTSVHPGGNWNWHNQTLGLIDSWHNGWLGASDNNLAGVLQFWSQQFQVSMGDIGNHIWVVEGTGCFKGCGINVDSPADVATSHIITLVTDVQTVKQYHVPFFYFSAQDFFDQGLEWPIGVQDQHGHAKPIRQDLSMGAVTFTMTCGSQHVVVKDQVQLLGRMYQGCAVPNNYLNILSA